MYKLSLGTRNLGDIRAHIIAITLYMLGLGGVIEGFYEPSKVAGWVKKPVRTGSVE